MTGSTNYEIAPLEIHGLRKCIYIKFDRLTMDENCFYSKPPHSDPRCVLLVLDNLGAIQPPNFFRSAIKIKLDYSCYASIHLIAVSHLISSIRSNPTTDLQPIDIPNCHDRRSLGVMTAARLGDSDLT